MNTYWAQDKLDEGAQYIIKDDIPFVNFKSYKAFLGKSHVHFTFTAFSPSSFQAHNTLLLSQTSTSTSVPFGTGASHIFGLTIQILGRRPRIR